jgi:hypothetical protein
LAEAEVVYRESLYACRNALPAGDAEIGDGAFWLGRILQVQGKLAEAEPLLREAVASRRNSPGPPDLPTSDIVRRLVEVLDQNDKNAEAAALRQEYGLPGPASGPGAFNTRVPTSQRH